MANTYRFPCPRVLRFPTLFYRCLLDRDTEVFLRQHSIALSSDAIDETDSSIENHIRTHQYGRYT
ncbi:hypothetical protein CKA32_006443 [Geitlerinema sp. FC II]|nr:hypothetical protein CKA32_006443 [Geitlerinema sp. FC II]